MQLRRRWIEAARPDQEIAGFVALAAGGSGIDAKIGNQAVLRRDPGQHPGAEPFGTETPDRLMAGPSEDARMPVEDRANVELLPDA